MPNSIGLYYPRVHLPHDAWIKTAALYWDKLGRIVPPNYVLHDSDTVRRLQGELGFVVDFTPTRSDTDEVGEMFLSLLDQYGDKLIRYYSTLSRESNLAYIYSDAKMADALAKMMLRTGLAVHTPRDVSRYTTRIGMHPKLAFIYMEALAVYMASSRGLQPVTDTVRDHVFMGKYTLERLTQALLEADDGQSHLVSSSPTPNEVEWLVAAIAIQSVLPRDVANVSVEKIIQLRQKHRTELTAFQTYIHELTANLDTIQRVDDPKALKAHIETVYERELKPRLDDLKGCMKSLAIETVVGVLNIKVALPPLLASVGAALHLAPISPEVAGAAAVACSVFPVYQKKRAEIREKVHTSPAAYLLYAQEGLTPTNVVSQVVRATRHLLLGV